MLTWYLQWDRDVSQWCVDQPQGEVDAGLLTRGTSIGLIDYSKAELVSIGSLQQEGTYERMRM